MSQKTDALVSCLSMNLSVSDSWGIGDLNLNSSGTLISLIYRHCCTVQKVDIKEGGKLTECHSN